MLLGHWDQKLNPKLNVGNFLPGMANLETMLPMLYDDGVRTGRITTNKWVDLVATTPAKLFGMFPQKGTIAVGSDADLAVWDPERTRTIRGEEMASNAGFDIYEGKEVRGWPEYTISRGEIIVDKGELVGSRGRGLRVLARAAPASMRPGFPVGNDRWGPILLGELRARTAYALVRSPREANT